MSRILHASVGVMMLS